MNNKHTCPYCKGAASIVPATRVYGPSGASYGNVLACNAFPVCDTYVGVHAGTDKPKGTLANATLRALRRQCHRLFDPTFASGSVLSRQEAYGLLANCLKRKEGHIGEMDVAECKSFIEGWAITRARFDRQQATSADNSAVNAVKALGIETQLRYVFIDTQPDRTLAHAAPFSAYRGQTKALQQARDMDLLYVRWTHSSDGKAKPVARLLPLGVRVIGALGTACVAEAAQPSRMPAWVKEQFLQNRKLKQQQAQAAAIV